VDIRIGGCALAYLRSHASELGLDPDRIAIMGYSAGGYLSSILAFAAELPELQPDCAERGSGPPNAVVVGAGRSDLRYHATDNLVEFLGGTPEELPQLWALASPLDHVDDHEPPALFVHGTTDRFVDVVEARRMHAALLAAGNESHLLELGGGGHIFNPGVDVGEIDAAALVDEPEVWLALVDFLAHTVGTP
jgi:acetyl esterase/lipase